MLQNIPKEKILEIVNQGPTLPAKIAKQLGGGGDTVLIGAILSTLISTGEVKVSTLKVGGSPLYYAPDQESKLEDHINYLNEKDRRTYTLLKEQKVLADADQDPLTRVSLRTIKDFAKLFEYDSQGQKILFWRFYSFSKDDALVLAKKMFSEKIVKETVEQPLEEPIEQKTPKIEHKIEEKIEQSNHVFENGSSKESNKDLHTDLHSVHSAEIGAQQVLEEPHQKHEHKTHEKTHERILHEHQHHETHSKSHHVEKESKEPKASKTKTEKQDYNFFELILSHVASKRLDVISKEKVKKTEYDLILKNHENNEYIYCKAKDKATISEGDLAPALIFAQNKKMPCLFISTGDLTKTASILITREFSGMVFERIIVTNGGQ